VIFFKTSQLKIVF